MIFLEQCRLCSQIDSENLFCFLMLALTSQGLSKKTPTIRFTRRILSHNFEQAKRLQSVFFCDTVVSLILIIAPNHVKQSCTCIIRGL